MKYRARVALSFFAMVVALLLVLFSVMTLPLDPVLVVLSLLLYAVGFIVLPKKGRDNYYEHQNETKAKVKENTNKKVVVKKTKSSTKIEKAEPETIKEKQVPCEPIENDKPIIRTSFATFPKLYNDALLRYSYYDVKIDAAEFSDSEIKDVQIETPLLFNLDDESRIIEVLGEDETIFGTIPNGRLKDMLFDYADKEGAFVGGHISRVDELSKEIQIALAFYTSLSDDDYKTLPHVDASLTKTKKKDWQGYSRMDNLFGLECGDTVILDYDYDTETYIVSNDSGDEIGEINVKNSEKLQEYEDEGRDLVAYVLSVDDEDLDNIKCKIRVIAK